MTDNGMNDPLPVKDKKDAAAWTRGVIDTMADAAGVTLDEKTENQHFSECVGKNDEVATDGRYSLSHSLRAPLPEKEHGDAVRRIRKELQARGYTIEGYREDPAKDPWALLDAEDPKSRLFVTAETYRPPNELVFIVRTPCLLPEGVEQEEVSMRENMQQEPEQPSGPVVQAAPAPRKDDPAWTPFG